MMDLDELLSEGRMMADAKTVIKRENTNGENAFSETNIRNERPSSVKMQNARRQETSIPPRTRKEPYAPHKSLEDSISRNDNGTTTRKRNNSRDEKLKQRYFDASKTWTSKENSQAEQEQHYQRHRNTTFNESKHSSVGFKNDIETVAKTLTLEDVLAVDEDLREWLGITEWNNVEYRERRLKNYRALMKIEAQRRKLLGQILAEEQCGVIRTSTNPPAKSTDISTKFSMQPPTAMITTNSRTLESTRATHSDCSDSNNHTLKRCYSYATSAYEHEKKVRYNPQGHKIRIENEGKYTATSSIPSHSAMNSGCGGRYDCEHEMSPGRRANETPQPPRSEFLQVESNAERGDWNGSAGRGNHRDNRFDPDFHERGCGSDHGGREHDLRSPEIFLQSQYSTERSSGEKWGNRETRYFIVKSFNEAMVVECQRNGIWTTQKHNKEVLTEAFHNYENVILCFSVNKSKAFQGYARMEGIPGSVEPSQSQKKIHWETAGAFPVRWLNMSRTGFNIVSDVMNIYNRHEDTNQVMSVIVGRDGQEIEGSAGAQLVELMDKEEERTRNVGPNPCRKGASPGKRYRDPNEEVGAIRKFNSANYAMGRFDA